MTIQTIAAPREDAVVARAPARGHIPGDPGGWALIFTEMSIFAFLFFAFLLEKSWDPQSFATARLLLDPTIGMVNTLVLLTSSYLVFMGVDACRGGNAAKARLALLAALACGLLFLCSKAYEYTGKLEAGITPQTNIFFSYYYALTALHLIHVVVGMLLIWLAVRRIGRDADDSPRFVEFSACFWHMVDLLWVVIFPLLYL